MLAYHRKQPHLQRWPLYWNPEVRLSSTDLPRRIQRNRKVERAFRGDDSMLKRTDRQSALSSEGKLYQVVGERRFGATMGLVV